MWRAVRSTAALVLVGVTAVTGSGCGNENGGGGDSASGITIVRTSDIEGWDPSNTMSVQAFQTLPMVMEGLVRPSVDGESIEPGLAEEWEVDAEAKTLTFTLREGLEFSDGSPVTSADVAFSVGLWRKGMAMGGLYSAITGTKTPDERTIVIEMSRPSTFTLTWLANGSAVVVPEDFGGRGRKAFFADPIGAGPFVIESHKVGQQLVLRRNPRYYDPERPHVDSVRYTIVADANQQLLRFQSGEADMIEEVPLDLASQIPEGQQVRVEPAATVNSIYVNNQRAPGDDIHFRRAVSLAIDRADFAQSVFDGQARPADGQLPPAVQGSVGCGCEYEFDVEQARAELAASSYESGKALRMVVPAGGGSSTREGERVAALLREVGIEVDIERQEPQVLSETIMNGEHNFTVGSISSVSSSVGDIFSLLIATDGMGAGVDMSAIADAFERFDVATTDEERAAAVREAEEWMKQKLPAIPTVFPDLVVAASEKLSGLQVAPWGYYPADRLEID